MQLKILPVCERPPPLMSKKTNPKIRNKKTKSGWNSALLDPVFGIQNEKWVFCIKSPSSERFTSSLLTPKTLRPQLPSRSQCALNHSQTALSQSRRWETEGDGGWGAGLPRENQYRYDAETKRVSYSREGRWFIDRSSSTYIAGGTCQTPDNKHELLFSGALQRVVVK